jgi:NAD(P)H dehydrogenase (quinone)
LLKSYQWIHHPPNAISDREARRVTARASTGRQSSLGSVLVYGAAGAQGSAIVRAALAAGATVRVLLRQGTANPFGDAVDIVRGDLADPARLHLASLGVDKVVLMLPQIADRMMVAQFGRNAIDAAKAAAVKLLVLNTSGPVPPARTGVAAIDAKVDLEAYLRASEISSIIVRPTLYMGNVSAPWSAPAIVHNGVFAYPLPADFQVTWISWEDLAAYIVEGLKRPDLAGRAFNVGGPEVLTGTGIAAELSIAVGRPVAYVPVPLADFAAALNAAFGSRMGDEITAFYAWIQKQAVSPLAVDPKPALTELPIRPTAFAEWAKAQDWQALAASPKAA